MHNPTTWFLLWFFFYRTRQNSDFKHLELKGGPVARFMAKTWIVLQILLNKSQMESTCLGHNLVYIIEIKCHKQFKISDPLKALTYRNLDSKEGNSTLGSTYWTSKLFKINSGASLYFMVMNNTWDCVYRNFLSNDQFYGGANSYWDKFWDTSYTQRAFIFEC